MTRAQLSSVGVARWTVAHRVASERWQVLSPTVIATTTGELTAEQGRWLAVLNGGGDAILGGLTAAEAAGLERWHRHEIVVYVPYAQGMPPPLDGVRYIRSRRPFAELRNAGGGVPRCRLEPAVLLFASRDRSRRTAQGVLAAAVQQRLTSAERLSDWVDRLRPLRRAALFRTVLEEIAGGAQSLAEVDVKRMCRRHGLQPPTRQVKRWDDEGRLRRTDCEWRRPDGSTVVLEVDGAFHMDVAQWEDDLARQRALTAIDRVFVRCTSRELRDDDARVARDLIKLGVPRAR